MGRLYDSDLRAAPLPEGAPRQVASIPAAQAATATPVVELTPGSWEYAEPEVAITVRLNRWIDTVNTGLPQHLWQGIEVTLDKQIAQRDRYYLVAALFPASCNWFACAPCRRTYKHKDRLQKIREAAGLRDLTWDPFQTEPNRYTARLDDPQRLHWEHGQVLGNGYLLGRDPSEAPRGRREQQPIVWSFGLVPEACLRHFALLEDQPPANDANEGKSGYVRIPPMTGIPPSRQALWKALAGRREGDTIQLMEAIRE